MTSRKQAAPEPVLLTVPETARLLGFGERMVWSLVRRGDLASVKIGGARRVHRAEVTRMLTEGNNKQGPA